MRYPKNYIKIKNLSGIYSIINIQNNRIYIGSAIRFSKRFNQHKNNLLKNKHDNQFLQNDYNKFKSKYFKFEIMEFVKDLTKLIEAEQKYLDQYFDNQINCYNICESSNSRLGISHSEETKQKISKIHKGRKKTEEHKKKIGAAHKGKKHTKEHNENYGESRAKTYNVKILAPDGRIFGPIKNLRKFCRENCLNFGDVWSLINGKRKYTHVKGWKILEQ